jgi:hypothetical protein
LGWIGDTGYGIQDSGYGIQDSGFGIQDSGFGIQDSGFGIQDSGCGMQDTGFGIADNKCLPTAGSKLPFNYNVIHKKASVYPKKINTKTPSFSAWGFLLLTASILTLLLSSLYLFV